jgi:uncharacterized protein
MTQSVLVPLEIPDEKFQTIIIPNEIIRDPVHKDIEITELERRIIDTTVFQRLRNISQLGLTYLIYPGATHNRFSHSLGTLFMADRMIQTCNKNYNNNFHPEAIKINKYEIFLTRIYSLIHDICNIPFGHTFEREGNLFNEDWSDPDRTLIILSDDKELMKVIKQFLFEKDFDEGQITQIISDIKNIILAKESDELGKYGFIKDIVSNTICADLLDYLQRDTYYCGLSERIGDRFLQYLIVAEIHPIIDESQKKNGLYIFNLDKEINREHKFGEKQKRIMIPFYQFDKNMEYTQKRSALSECIDLLRKRYSLCQKVYYHRTKMSASAMIIEALNRNNCKKSSEYIEKCDIELMHDLSNGSSASSLLIKCIESRKLYRPIYSLEHNEIREGDPDSDKIEKIIKQYRSPAQRFALEEELEQVLEFKPGELIIYCPDPKMNMKAFKMLIQLKPDNNIKPLEQLQRPEIQSEIKQIKQNHLYLWQFIIFIHPDRYSSRSERDKAAGLCSSRIGLPNNIEQFRSLNESKEMILLDGAILEWDNQNPENKVYASEIPSLLTHSGFKGTKSKKDYFDAIKQLKKV